MNIQEILSLPEDKWLTELQVDPVERDIQANLDYFDGVHPILTKASRQDYFVDKWEIDPQTNEPKLDAKGQKIAASPELVERTRLVLNYQQQIVQTAVGMCVGKAVTLTLNNGDTDQKKEAFDTLVDMWRNKTRLDTFSIKMAEALFVESKCAELYFYEDSDIDKDIKVMLLSKKNGDDIWAHFDDANRMDALTRVYTKRALIDGEAKDVEVTEIWTSEKTLSKIDDGAWETKQIPFFDKLTIVYYDQEKPEFHLITELINKQEMVRSQNSDVNKRVGNPAVVIDGVIDEMPSVEDDVTVWNTVPTSDADGKQIKSSVSYLQLTGAHDAIDSELKMDQDDMYKLSWPDLSFLREMSVGQLSGTAIKLMFTDAFVKIGVKRGIFEDFSRRVSVMKAMLAKANGEVFNELNISVTFNSILPEDIVEISETLSTAVGAGFMAKEDAVAAFPPNDGNPDAYQNVLNEQALESGGTAP